MVVYQIDIRNSVSRVDFQNYSPSRSPTGWETVHILDTSEMQKACYRMICRLFVGFETLLAESGGSTKTDFKFL